jgi:disulfide bond formation protein DsbB
MINATPAALSALLIAGALLAGAQVLEHSFGLDPCPLCLMQRLWVIVTGSIVLAGLMHDPQRRAYPIVALSSALAGAGFAIRQLWLQNLPPDQVPGCMPDMEYMIDSFPLIDILRAMTMGTGDCAKVDWAILGVSLAGWSLAGFILLASAIGRWLTHSGRPHGVSAK